MSRHHRMLWSAVGRVLLLVGLCTSIVAQNKPVPSRIMAPVDTTKTFTVKGSTTALITRSTDLGRMQADHNLGQMLLMLTPTKEQDAALDDLVKQLHSPSSPQFHKWLKPAEVGARFGVSEQDAIQVRQWLQSQGFDVRNVASSRRFISFGGTVSQVEQAFRTEMHQYSYKGQEFIANSKEIAVPAALQPVVRGVVRLSSTPRTSNARIVGKGEYDKTKRQLTFTDGNHGMTPADFATIYNLNPLYQAGINGAGQNIAIVARSNFNIDDVFDFVSMFGIPWMFGGGVTINGDDPGVIPGEAVEATLDTLWAIAVAPGASVWTVVSQSNFADGVDISAAYIVDNNLAPIMSTSFSGCEQVLGPLGTEFYRSLWAQAAAQGITAIVSSNDAGGAGCDDPNSGYFAQNGFAVNGVASTPFNVAVGGTQFDDTADPSQYWSPTNDPTTLGSALSYIPEKVWNESSADNAKVSLLASGGGVSTVWAKPEWQIGATIPNDGMRDLPDISFTAASHDGYTLCYGYSCESGVVYLIGGTSASAPAFAGIMALVNQKTGSAQGNANYVLYQLASQHPEIFHDITTGNNKVPDQEGKSTIGFDAGSGYDLATGLGSADVTALVNNWASVQFGGTTTTLAGPGGETTFVHGMNVPLVATVTAASGTENPTGLVSFSSTDNPRSADVLPLPYLSVGTATLDNTGVANASVSEIPGGTHNIVARYAGDAKFTASTSESVTVTITPEPSTALLWGYVGGSLLESVQTTYGVPITAAVLVQGQSTVGHPNGFVTVGEGSAIYAEQGLNYGESEIADFGDHTELQQGASSIFGLGYYYDPERSHKLEFLGAGTHNIIATYPGDASFQPATSAPLQIIVNKSDSFISFNFDGTPLANTPTTVLGQVALASGARALTTGTVTFTAVSGTTSVNLGTVSVDPTVWVADNPGLFQGQLTLPSAGSWTVTAAYTGDANVNPSRTEQQLNVQGTAPTEIVLKTSSLSAAAGTAITFNAQVTSSATSVAPTGTVTFIDGSSSIGTVTLDGSGIATFTTNKLAGGVHSITASYSGDAASRSSLSSAIAQNISDFSLTASTDSLTIEAGQSGTTTFVVVPLGGYNQSVNLSCTGLPAGAVCSFSPSAIKPDGTNPVNSTLTIRTSTTSAALLPANRSFGWLSLSGFGLVGIVAIGSTRNRRLAILTLVAVLALTLVAVGCGGGSKTVTPAPNPVLGTYTLTVTVGDTVGVSHNATVKVSIVQ